MRLLELFEQRLSESIQESLSDEWNWQPFWFNTKTKKIVTVEMGFTHAGWLILYPEQFNFTSEYLLKSDLSPKVKRAINNKDGDKIAISEFLDGDASILKFMSKHGWVRCIIEDDVILSIQAYNKNELLATARYFFKTNPKLNELNIEVKIQTNPELRDLDVTLVGKRLELFLKYGNIPSKSIVESNKILKEYTQSTGFIHDEYKFWKINVAKKKTPNGKVRGNAIHMKYKDRQLGPIDGISIEDVMSKLRKMIDDIMIGQRKGLEGAKGVTIDFNAPFTRQIFAEIGDITAARFNQENNKVYLEIMDPEYFEAIGPLEGFKRIGIRDKSDSETATNLYSFTPTMTDIKKLGLEANGRYTVEQESKAPDDPYWRFSIDHHSTAYDKSERMQLSVPGFNVAVW